MTRSFLLSCFPISNILLLLLHVPVQAPELHRVQGHCLSSIAKRRQQSTKAVLSVLFAEKMPFSSSVAVVIFLYMLFVSPTVVRLS